MALLRAQTLTLDAVIGEMDRLDADMDKPAIRVPLLMLQAAGVSIHSLLALTRERDMSIRDGFGIARSVIETAVNAAYIAVGGETVAEQAIKHMRQKRWRDLSREASVGGWRMKVRMDVDVLPDDVPGLPEALKEYTNKRGSEVRDWTPDNIEKRIDAVAKKCPGADLPFGAAVFAIYRPSSELLHGTYYGVEYFWQGSSNQYVGTKEAFDRVWLFDHFVTLLSTAFFAVAGSVHTMSAVFNLRKENMQVQERLNQELMKLVDEMNTAAGTNDQPAAAPDVAGDE